MSRKVTISPHSLENRQTAPPWVVLFVGILAVSTASLFIRLAQQEASSLVIAASRMSLAALILAPGVLLRNQSEIKRIERRSWFWLIVTGGLLALHFASWITSLEYTSVASSVVLVTTTPLWVAILSPLVLKEKLGRNVQAGLALAMLGGIIVSLNEACSFQAGFTCRGFGDFFQGRAFTGNVLALVGAWCAAGYLTAGRRLRVNLSLSSYTFIVYGSAAVVLLAACWLTRQRLAGYSGLIYIWFIALAVIPQLIGHSSFNWALKYVSAARVSVVLLGEPIGSAILAMIFLKEMPGVLEIAGGVLILIGIYFVAAQNGK